MPLQTNDLVMVALGVQNDAPPIPLQPPLVDGIHLRWAFPREKGFPWHGYYIFRRPHEFRGQLCIREDLTRLPLGPLGRKTLDLAVGRLSSDAELVCTDDFADTGITEFDLAGRSWLRLDLPNSDPAFRVDLRLGCRGDTDRKLKCIDFSSIQPGAKANPLLVEGVAFHLVVPSRKRPIRHLDIVGGAARLFPGGVNVSGELEVRLQEAVRTIEVLGTLLEGSAAIEAIGTGGEVVASIKLKKGTEAKPQRIRLNADADFVRCRIVVRAGRFVAHRFCYSLPSNGGTNVDIVALDGDIVVASTIASGKAGKVVPVTLQADRITAVRLSGGAAALVELCVRPVSLGLYKDWQLMPNCPEPLTLPIVHPDYPAQRGPENVTASQTQAGDRIVYGPRAPLEAEFDELYKVLRALVVGGPPGSPTRAMADPSRAAVNVAGVPGQAAPNVPDPHVRSLHPLDLVLMGALHPPIAQMVGLYWADQTAHTAGVYDYLIVADHAGIGKGSAMKLLSSLPRNWHRVDGWICFARRAQPEPSVSPPREVRAYSLPGGSFRANAPAGSPIADSAGNVGLTWAIEKDDLGFLRSGAPIFYQVWRDRQGNQAAPTPSADATELATSNGPLLVSHHANIQMEPPQYPGDWPPFSLNFLDFALFEGWYGYKVNAIDIFGRYSAKSPFAEWRQWAPQPNPKPWYYIDPAQDRQVHPSSIRVRDVEPPPPPTAVEAWALDPEDRLALQDQAYLNWRATLPQNVRNTLIGLRVRWRWTVAQQRQAPDVTEFRIYWHPGTNPPAEQQVLADGQTRWVLKDISHWETRCHVCPYGQSFTVEANGDRSYHVFLPVAGAAGPFINGVPLNPTLADPIAYGQVTVTAVDDAAGVTDRWPGVGTWAARTGNESRAASPVRVFRVYRVPPPPPEPVVDSDRVYATPADWHGHSFYSFRWRPQSNLKTHVHRAMDEAVFVVDWAKRSRPALDPNDLASFPNPAAEPTWNAAKRAQVAQTLNAFNDLANAGATRPQALVAYRALNDDALRILASLPGNEKAFTQLTIQPLGPADPGTADRRGPDDPENYVPRPTLRYYIDKLDGLATNRYLYRASYVDQAHNRSALGPVGTPVRLPNVVPPRAPIITKVVAGERKITISWVSNREPDLLEYRVFRAGSAEDARDLRSMIQVAIVAADPDPVARPAEVTWIDEPVRGLVDLWYRVVAVDRPDPVDPRGGGGNVSEPSAAVKGRAVDTLPPNSPTWLAAQRLLGTAGVRLAWQTDEPGVVSIVSRRQLGGVWRSVSAKLSPVSPPFDFEYVDATADPGAAYEYRIVVEDEAGNRNSNTEVRVI